MQFNLLPDVKLEYLKAQRSKRFVTFIALCVGGTALAIFLILLFNVHVMQRQHMSHLNEDIATDSRTLENIPDLDKILTVQNQLASLPGLHDEKPVATRLFNYLSQVTPTQITISQLEVSFDETTIRFEGSADALSTVNKFIDTLKFTKYTLDGETVTDNSPLAFSDVVLSNFGINETEANYTIDLTFDPTIFDSASEVGLVVPQIVSTRSAVERPDILFREQEDGTGGQ